MLFRSKESVQFEKKTSILMETMKTRMMAGHQVRYDVVCGTQEMIESLDKREQRVPFICRISQ